MEPAVWTDAMLTALERGVKGGVWYSLIDKVYAERNLRAAWEKVARNKGVAGVDGQTVREYRERLEQEIGWLHHALREGTYQPQPIRRVYIPKPGSQEKRQL